MRKRCRFLVVLILAAVSCVTGFAPLPPRTSAASHQVAKIRDPWQATETNDSDGGISNYSLAWLASNQDTLYQPLQATKANGSERSVSNNLLAWLAAAAAPLALFTALPAEAAANDSGFVLVSAFVAYVHYASLLTIVGILVTERLLVKPEMTNDEEELLWKADALYGIAGLALTISGYYRAVEYGKGWYVELHVHGFSLYIAFLVVSHFQPSHAHRIDLGNFIHMNHSSG